MSIGLPAGAQAPVEAGEGRRLLDEARALAGGDGASRTAALVLLGRVVDEARQASSREVEAEARLTRGDLRLNLGRDEPEALTDLQTAATLFVADAHLSQAARASTLSGIVLRRLGRLDDAETAHRQALAWYDAVGDRAGLGTVHHNLGALLFSRSRLDEAEAAYGRALALRRDVGDVASTAGTLNNLATIHGNRGDLDKAIEAHREARDVARMSGRAVDLAYATLGLGTQSFALGTWQESIDHLIDAASQFETMGDRSGLAFARHTLGVVYLALGHDVDAVTTLESVLPLRTHDPARLGTTLQSLAGAYRAAGRLEEARAALERALALKRQASDTPGEAATLRSLAALEAAEGRRADAIRHAARARTLAAEIGRPDGIALAAALSSRVTDSEPDPALTIELERLANDPVVRRVPRTEAILRAELARAALRRGDLARARDEVATALDRVEQVRAGVAALDLRASYLASHADLLDLEVDLLLRSHEASPNAGHDRAAFVAAERARSRRLSDALADALTPLPTDNPLRARERRLEDEVSIAALKLERAQGSDRPDVQAALDRRLLALRTFRAEMRAQLPWRRDAPRLELNAIQARLPEDTAVIAYWLGAERSVAWVLHADGLNSVRLPGRSAIEGAVREARSAIDDARPAADALRRLAALLVHPLEPHVRARRLGIVLDGVLESVPVAALPLADGRAVLDRFQTVRLPSARWVTRTSGPRLDTGPPRVAIVADPVYGLDDARLVGRTGEGPRTDRGTSAPEAPARLRFSRQEADAIAALVTATVLTDFEASKPSVAALPLGSFDVLHLASHASQHATRPDLSGLVLSLVDESGRPVDGRLRLHEVVGLALSGQTVVLSACQTVIGPDLRGEGLQGLARGFLQAGAGTVVASLWDVDDRATMVLMRHFYEALVRDGGSAPRALEQAQQRMRADLRWADPRHWAGFVALGTLE